MIEVKGLCKSFNHLKILEDLNLTVEKSEIRVIIGRSGCGKTVLLKLIAGILKPDKGKIVVGGIDINNFPNKRLHKMNIRMGMVFQGNALFDSLTVGENVGFWLRENMYLDEKIISEKVERALELVQLPGIQNLMPSELSGGMKKRVALARAICLDPEVILYDEPTTGIDPITQDCINSLILDLRDKLNVTSVVVTHDINSCLRVADRISMLYQGKIIAEGTKEDLKNIDHPIVRQFISGSSIGPIQDPLERFI